MSNIIEFAKSEFIRAGWCDLEGNFKDETQGLICKDVTELLSLLSDQGHSGFSASYALNLFDKLARFSPISPLTGADDEWSPVGDDTYQNKHCPSVFKKGENGKAYWLDYYIFRYEDGSTFTSGRSRQFIEFPWSEPKPIIVDVTTDKDGNTIYPDFIKSIY